MKNYVIKEYVVLMRIVIILLIALIGRFIYQVDSFVEMVGEINTRVATVEGEYQSLYKKIMDQGSCIQRFEDERIIRKYVF